MTASYLPQKVASGLFALLILSMGIGIAVVATGGAAAQTDTATATPTETATATDGNDTQDDSLVALPTNETLAVDNDTRELLVTAENTNGTLDVTVEGIDADGNATQVTTGTLNASGVDATDTYAYSIPDSANYSEYRVTVSGDGAEHLSIAKSQVVGGGGGGFGGSGITIGHAAAGAIAVIAALGLAAWRAN